MDRAPPSPGCSGAISRLASRDRSMRMAPAYPWIVPARSTADGCDTRREPPRRTNSANRTSVSRLYVAPPGEAGSTNGMRSVEWVKSSNHESAVAVRLASVVSTMRARDARRRASSLRDASSE
eukprot:1919311-Pleurochrysis_carterae.AAC.1